MPPGIEGTIGTYISRGGSPFASSHDCGITVYSPFPMLWRSELIVLFPLGSPLTTVADGCDAPDFTDRQPPMTRGFVGSVPLSSLLMLGGVPRFVFPLQLPPVRLPEAGRSMVP